LPKEKAMQLFPKGKFLLLRWEKNSLLGAPMTFQVSHYSFWKKNLSKQKKTLGSNHRMIPYHIYVY
jgi:hypothetical protein